MKLTLRRRHSTDKCTIGSLYVNGVFLCNTLEDVVREIKGVPVPVWKIPGKTAIPSGTYRIVINHSPRFNRILPLLLDVPGFEGVRIHPGNTDKDTEGCILPGTWNGGDRVDNSAKAFTDLIQKLNEAVKVGESISIQVLNTEEQEYDY